MVVGQLIRITLRHEESQHGHINENWESDHMYIIKTKKFTKSSAEDLVEINNSMGQILQTQHFLAEKGIYMATTAICQDNKSTILLSVNRTLSRSNGTCHLNFRVTDESRKASERGVLHCREHVCRFLHADAILNPASNQSTELHRSVLNWMENKKNNKISMDEIKRGHEKEKKEKRRIYEFGSSS